jgi:hypothetical protein
MEPEILMDECEFADTDLTLDELRACQACMSGKYHDFFLKRKDPDE